MSDVLAKALCPICGEDVYFFVNSDDSNESLELTCSNGHTDRRAATSNLQPNSNTEGKFARSEMAAAAG